MFTIINKTKAILLVCLLFTGISHAQTEDVELEKYLKRSEGYKYSNIIKVNTLAIALNNISVSYERAIRPRLSFLISAGYKYSGKEPSIFQANSSTIEADLDKITGLTITPEIRYYLKTCESRFLEGFYLGLYFRYTSYNSGVDFTYFPELTQNIEFYKSDVNLTEVGAGLQLGYQLVLWERFNIDFMFFGPRYSNYNLVYEFDNQVSDAFLTDLSAYLNEVIDRFGLDYEVELKQNGEASASNSFSFASMRFGISFGFSF